MMRLLLYLVIMSFAGFLNAQYFSSPPNIDGNIDAGYITQGAWSMGWDDDYLYLHYDGGQPDEPAIFYIDFDPLDIVSGGSNSDGSLTGQTNWDITPDLPFRSDFMIYWESGYAEFRTDDGSGNWSGTTAITTSNRSNTGSSSREIRLSWTSMMGLSGRPSSFNWLGYANSRANPGFIFNEIPGENPEGVNSSPLNNYYFTVSNTSSTNSTDPFSQTSIEHRGIDDDMFIVSSNTVFDVTNNSDNTSDEIVLENNSNNFTLTVNGKAKLKGGLVVNSGETLQFNSGSIVSIQANGFINNNSSNVLYDSTNTTLVYNTGGPYPAANEWPNSDPPFRVIIESSDVTLLGARSTTDLRVRGGSFDCNSNDLVISEDGLVVANASITSNGNLIFNDGASLIDSASTTNPGGSITGNITVKRTATEYDNVFNYWSTPVSGADYSDVWTFGTNAGQFLANDLYKWDNSSATLDWANPSTGTTMTPGEGFILTGPIDGGSNTRTFTGPPNNGNISANVIVNGTGAQDDDDYNLLGNPYPSAIDAVAFYNDNSTQITGTFWFWDVDITKDTFVSADYATYTQGGGVGSNPHGPNPDQYISSCQGFFVEASGSGGTNTVTFSNSHRMQDNNSQFFKSAPVERMWLTAMSAQGHGNKMLVGFSPVTTDDYDAGWDGKKLKGNEHIAFYSKIGEEDYAIQILSRLHQNKSVPLGLDAGNPGTYTISIDSIDGISNDIDILLENTSTGNYYDLRENDYTLSVSEAKTVDNLVLHFRTQSTGIDLEQEEPLVNIWQSGSNLIVKDLDNAPLKNIRVVDINGRTIRHINEPAGSLTQFGVSDWPAGIYLVEVTSSDYAQTQKIFIK